MNISRVIYAQSSSNYRVKKQAVDYVIDDSGNRSFNVYYDMPFGLNTGYSYLFKVLGKNPQEGGENLYILELIRPSQFELVKYLKAFKDKQIFVKVIGFIHLIVIK